MKAFSSNVKFEKDEQGREWVVNTATGARRLADIGDESKGDATAKACAASEEINAPQRPGGNRGIDEIEEA